MKPVALLGDPSDHGGVLSTTATDGKLTVGGVPVCANGCTHVCPIIGHGSTPVVAVTVKSLVKGKLIVTQGAVAGCGAVIQPPDRLVYVE